MSLVNLVGRVRKDLLAQEKDTMWYPQLPFILLKQIIIHFKATSVTEIKGKIKVSGKIKRKANK